MSTNHPGHSVLRQLFPETHNRRSVVRELCEKSSTHSNFSPVYPRLVMEVCSGWGRTVTSVQAIQITNFINSI